MKKLVCEALLCALQHKRIRQQPADRRQRELALLVRQNHNRVQAKLGHKLAARATGRACVVGHHSDGNKVALALADGFGVGRALAA